MARLPWEILSSAVRGLVRFHRGQSHHTWAANKRASDADIGRSLAVCLRESQVLTAPMAQALRDTLDLYIDSPDVFGLVKAPPDAPIGPGADGQEWSAETHAGTVAAGSAP